MAGRLSYSHMAAIFISPFRDTVSIAYSCPTANSCTSTESWRLLGDPKTVDPWAGLKPPGAGSRDLAKNPETEEVSDPFALAPVVQIRTIPVEGVFHLGAGRGGLTPGPRFRSHLRFVLRTAGGKPGQPLCNRCRPRDRRKLARGRPELSLRGSRRRGRRVSAARRRRSLPAVLIRLRSWAIRVENRDISDRHRKYHRVTVSARS